jgi:hypothetical protein
MSDQFDPYHKWLGIAPKDQPPHHYRLLGIDPFEDDREVIDSAANRVMTYLKELAMGDDDAHSQRIMNEVMQARLCLLNAKKKAVYDNELREKLATSQPPPPRVTPPSAKPQTTNATNLPSPVAVVATSSIPERHRSVSWLMTAISGGIILLAAVILILVAVALKNGQPDETELARGQSDNRKAEAAEPVHNIETKQAVLTDSPSPAKPAEAAPSPKKPEQHAPTDVPSKDASDKAAEDTGPTDDPDDPSKAKEVTGKSTEDVKTPVASPVVHTPEPVPSAEAQERARRSALEGYRGEIVDAKTTGKRVVLARRIWRAAADKSLEAPARFVLLSEARNLAIAAADVTLADEIADDAKRDFTIDSLPASESALDAAAAALEQLSGAAKTPDDSAAVAEIGLALADQAAGGGRPETAKKIAETALSAARKSKDDELVKKATLRWLDLQ